MMNSNKRGRKFQKRLNADKVDFKKIMKLKAAWKELEIIQMDVTNEYFQSQQLVIREVLKVKEELPIILFISRFSGICVYRV